MSRVMGFYCSKFHVIHVFIALMFVLWPSIGNAKDSPDGSRKLSRTTLRSAFLLMSIDKEILEDDTSIVSYFSSDLSHQFENELLFELNFSLLDPISSGPYPSFAVRGGYGYRLHGHRNMRKVALRGYLTPLFGYRFADRPVRIRDSFAVVRRTHNLHAGAGYELEIGKRSCFSMRFYTGFDYAIAQRIRNPQIDPNMALSKPFRLGRSHSVSVGYSFHGVSSVFR